MPKKLEINLEEIREIYHKSFPPTTAEKIQDLQRHIDCPCWMESAKTHAREELNRLQAIADAESTPTDIPNNCD